jgi:hypothetical protein
MSDLMRVIEAEGKPQAFIEDRILEKKMNWLATLLSYSTGA